MCVSCVCVVVCVSVVCGVRCACGVYGVCVIYVCVCACCERVGCVVRVCLLALKYLAIKRKRMCSVVVVVVCLVFQGATEQVCEYLVC